MMRLKGFTLVELMVVMSIVAVLMLVTVPYGGTWIRSAKLSVAKGELTQAHGFAKGAAFRNQWGAINNDPVVAMCVADTNSLTVLEKTETDEPDCSTSTGNVIWTAQLDTAVSVTQNSTPLSCMCYDNLAQLTVGSCAGCSTIGTLDISIGGDNETIFLD